jgi:hypothetical protein
LLGELLELNGGAGFATGDELEVRMATTEYVLETLTDIRRHVKLLTAATRVPEILGATRNYLASWSRARVENLQMVDGGWGPFDYHQRPEPMHGVADIILKSNALSRHRSALKAAGIEATPEFLELDLYFALAKQAVESLTSVKPRPYMATPRRFDHRDWSDSHNQAAAA